MSVNRGQIAEPVWVPGSRVVRSKVPAGVLNWLLDQASLTRRLQTVCSGEFRVHVISQAWSRPMMNEAKALRLSPGKFALVRQVELLCGDVPFVYARTVIPRKTLSGSLRRLAHLQSRSLGATLFALPGMRRGEVEIANLRGSSRVHRLLSERGIILPPSVWARRSVFHVYDKPLLVSEVFLPAMEELHF